MQKKRDQRQEEAERRLNVDTKRRKWSPPVETDDFQLLLCFIFKAEKPVQQ